MQHNLKLDVRKCSGKIIKRIHHSRALLIIGTRELTIVLSVDVYTSAEMPEIQLLKRKNIWPAFRRPRFSNPGLQ